MSWFKIQAKGAAPDKNAAPQAATVAEVLIYGDIGYSWWEEGVEAASFVRALSQVDAEEVHFRINSYGGSVDDGVAIYNAIQRHPAKTVSYIDGIAASIASVIAIASDEVVMADNASMMIHAPWGWNSGTAQDMRDYADVLDHYAEKLATSYANRTGKSREQIITDWLDNKDHWFTGEEAVAAGLVDRIGETNPVNASFDRAVFMARFQAARRGVPQFPAASLQGANPMKYPKHRKLDEAKPDDAPGKSSASPVAAATPPALDEQSIVAAALAKDAQRRSQIAARFEAFAAQTGVSKLLAGCQNDTGCTVEAAGEKLLAHLAKGVTSITDGHTLETVSDETDKRMDGMVAALLVRAGLADKETRAHAAASEFRGLTLLDMARAALERGGVKARGRDKMEVVGMAFTQSTSDFPLLLENTMHKALQTAYAVTPDTWSRFCRRGSVSDFRAHNRYRVASIGNLVDVDENGEFKTVSIPDGEKSTITATTKGHIINVSRQMIVNDDLGAFLTLAAARGRAAARTIEAMVYALLAENSGAGPTMSDGLPLFHADHGNLIAGGSGAAPTVDSFDAMRILLATQMDVGGNDFLALTPALWLGPIGLGGKARVVNNSTYDPDAANKLQRDNMVRNMVSDIVDTPRLSGTAHYIFADPAMNPVIEVAFLDGADMPYLETQAGFTVDGMQMKTRLDVGVAGIDYRGAVRNAGA